MEKQLKKIKEMLIEKLEEYNNKPYQEEKLTLNPVLPMEKIIEFEEKYNIKLPEELVDFYTQVADGALLYPDEDICNLSSFEEWYFDKDSIQKDFIFENDLEYDDFRNLSDTSFLWCGNIAVMELGCAMTYNIIVKGKRYGEMYGDFEMWLPFTNKNFLDWLESCLDGTAENIL
ncbi:MAG: SMI1/KNR4 family protein [Ruminococcus flavefaciens]|nr:SMI1/KNR4 family protein [Ruminococcus flavefaciens]